MWHQIGRRIGFAPFLSRLSTLSESVNKVKVSDVTISTAPTEKLPSENLTPTRVVEMLDRHIIGQKEAKKAVAIAFRNRWRRHRIPPELKEEVVPKNILMIGPTGCGKTEIARRLAKLADAPFVKVEATKFTEVGFHGRDVDQIIRDLVENTIQLLKHKVRSHKVAEVESTVEAIILDNVFKRSVENECTPSSLGDNYEEYRKCYRDGNFDNMKIIMELPSRGRGASFPVVGDFSDIVGKVLQLGKVSKPPKFEVQESTVKEARERLEEAEYEKLFNSDQIIRDAIMFAESDGIIFIDEIDKIVTSPDMRHGHEASSEGVQRDLLPLLEGSTVETKYGSVKTDHILFICSGAFHSCKPSDMLAELQGRLPIRVELQGLTCKDFYRILTEPEANLIKQQVALMETENVKLVFSDDAIKEMSFIAAEINKTVQNIGARRLHTVIERVVEDASFNASEKGGETYIIGKEEVRMALGSFLTKSDLSRFIL